MKPHRRPQFVGRKPRLTPEHADELRAWAAQRMTLAEKAAQLGVSRTTVSNYIRGALKRQGYA